MFWARFLFCVTTWACCGVVWAATGELRVLELKHRPAEDLLPVIVPLLGQDGAATALDNRLILRAPAKDLATIEKLVSQLDVAREMLRIAVRQERSAGGARIPASAKARTGRSLSTDPGEDNHGEAFRTLGNTRQNTEQYLQVLDGEAALIEVGRQLPYPRIRAYVTGRQQGFVEVTDFQEVGTGFLVRPRLLGEKVELEISPYQAEADQGPGGTIEFGSMSSRVEIPLEEWFDLGGHLEQETGTNEAGLSLHAGPGNEARHLWIKVTR